jgi:phosphatidylinositol 4-kinase
MEDAVESLVVEEESKKLMNKKSIFHRFRNKSTSENNNGSDGKDSALVSDKMTPNEVGKDTPVSTTGLNEDNKDLADSSTIHNEEHKDVPISSTSPNEDSIDNKSKCNGVKEKILNGIKEKSASSSQKSSSCLLLRLFESKLFDMSIAMSYLFKSKECGVQTYLGNKLFVSICGLYPFGNVFLIMWGPVC